MSDNDKQRELSEEERLLKEIAEGGDEDKGKEEEGSETADQGSVEKAEDGETEKIDESEPSASETSGSETLNDAKGSSSGQPEEKAAEEVEQRAAAAEEKPFEELKEWPVGNEVAAGTDTPAEDKTAENEKTIAPVEREENTTDAAETDEKSTDAAETDEKSTEIAQAEEKTTLPAEAEENVRGEAAEREEEVKVTDEPATPEAKETGEEGDMAEKTGENQEEVSVKEEQGSGPEKKEQPEKETAGAEDGGKKSGDQSSDSDDDDDMDEEEEKDYSEFTKEQVINELDEILKGDNLKKIERQVKELKHLYDDFYEAEKKAALEKFKEEGGAAIDFQYAGDALDNRFSSLYDKYKTRRQNYYASLEKEKEVNLQQKHEILEKLRSVVDGEETTTSIGVLKELQKEWRSIGPVPSQYAKSLWATYNILIDRFYDNRSIYFELKELDRKKNLESKLELCEKAEALLEYENIRDAVKELNDLHEEFKHIGPVPKEVQEEVWQRFKAASDAVYSRRKDFVADLKKDLHKNLEEKQTLVEEVSSFREFNSDQISEWNEKTRDLLAIQKKWERIGGLPREHAKEVNKRFWSNFKSFFNNKNKFFKKLEGLRDENLKLKEELITKAEELKESEDWENTANALKELQKQWKNIGPVPEKVRNEVYKRFKAACDTFFDRRRAHSKDIEKDYKENLKIKEEICDTIESMAEKGTGNIDQFKTLQMQFDKIGFVPRNAIRKIQKRYEQVTTKFLASIDVPDAEKSELKFTAEINRLKTGPNADNRINRKEGELRRLIGKLENDIALWKNNLEFFADSKTADKVREDFTRKIEDATKELNALKEELKVLNKI